MTGQEIKQSAEPRFYGYIVVVSAFLIMVAIWGTYYAFGIFFTPVLTEFGWTRALTSGAFSLSMLGHGLLGIVMGVLTDRLGPRIVMTLCGVLLGLGHLLMSQIYAVWQLYLFYGVIIGIGMGGAFVPIVSTVARWFVRKRNMMTGIVMAGTGIAALTGPPVASQLIYAYDWRTSYIVAGSVLLVVVVLASQFLKRDPTQMRQVPYGESEGNKQRLEPKAEGFSLGEAICTIQFWVVFAMFFCFGFCLFTIIVHIAPHATELGISATNAANILAIFGGLTLVGRVAMGSAADRIGNRQSFIIGFILMSAALFWVVPATKMWMLYLFSALFGFAQGGIGVSESPAVAQLFGLRSHGFILGVVSVGFTVGAAVGPLLAGYIFDVTGSYQRAFLVAAVVAVLGILLAIALRPIRDKPQKESN